MSTYNGEKRSATNDRLEAFARSYSAYYADATTLNMAALQKPVKRRLWKC